MTEEIRKLLTENAVVKLWPDAGQILKLSRNGTYSAAASGFIKTIDLGRLKRVPTAWLRQQIGIDQP
jgi:hypothetical protein